ncbi:MAG: acyltransferase family protein [Schleiferiaceae bacterium]
MMILGVVIHASVTYSVNDLENHWPLKDPNGQSLGMDGITHFIHTFRIPVFFLVSGYFSSILAEKRTWRGLLKNRFQRIALPFVVFLFALWFPIQWGFEYSGSKFYQDLDTLDWSQPMTWVPKHTFHLWFLYYLIFILAIAIVWQWVQETFRKPLSHDLPATFSKFRKEFWGHPFLRWLSGFLILFLSLATMNLVEVDTPVSFQVNLRTLYYYFIFFIIGWAFYALKVPQDSLKKYPLALLMVGCLSWGYYASEMDTLEYLPRLTLRVISVWSLVLGFLALFIRWVNTESKFWRYLSDASYWIYLIHLPIAIIIPGLIADWEVSVGVKFGVVMLSEIAFTLLTYHFLVRSTFIGKFLNGRKYPK